MNANKRVNIPLPPELILEAKKQSRIQGVLFQKFVELAIQTHITKCKKAGGEK